MEKVITGPGEYRLRNGDTVNVVGKVDSKRLRQAGWVWQADNYATHRDDGLSQFNLEPWPFDIVSKVDGSVR